MSLSTIWPRPTSSIYSRSSVKAPTDDGQHHRPLALLYADALDAETPEQRNRALRSLGDLALFISGIFTDSLARKLVDVDYYVGMGASAYISIHDSLQQRTDQFARGELFGELARQFSTLVDVLAEISEMSGLKSNSNVLKTYEIWLHTGSERARKQLARSNIFPLSDTHSLQTH